MSKIAFGERSTNCYNIAQNPRAQFNAKQNANTMAGKHNSSTNGGKMIDSKYVTQQEPKKSAKENPMFHAMKGTGKTSSVCSNL